MAKKKKQTQDEIKQEYIEKYYEDEQLLKDASEEEREQYIEYVEEGITKDWLIALYAKAYGCYGGNEVFACDWVTSRDCLLRIIELQGDADPFVYNTLGYIYYYGRCNGGTPEYDLAFKYFSVGAANGVFESMYKSADMYMSGRGVPKSEKAGANIIFGMYSENKDIFCNKGANCKFADVALRMGGLFEKGCGCEQDYESAYYHYCEALYAIQLRMKECEYYGDGKVLQNAQEALARVEEKLPEDFFEGDKLSLPFPLLLGNLLEESVGLDIELKEEKGEYYIEAKRYASEELLKNCLLNIPQIRFCKLINEIRLKIAGLESVDLFELPKKAFINSITRGEDERNWIFSFRDMTILEITCDEFVFEGEWR